MIAATPAWADNSPYNFFATWFACPAAYNHHWFCDQRIDQSIRQAQALEATNARGASVLWANIDRELVDRAAWVPLVNPRQIDFVSKHAANYQHTPPGGHPRRPTLAALTTDSSRRSDDRTQIQLRISEYALRRMEHLWSPAGATGGKFDGGGNGRNKSTASGPPYGLAVGAAAAAPDRAERV